MTVHSVRRATHGAQGETVVRAQAIGPFVVTYVNPNDDPGEKTTAAT